MNGTFSPVALSGQVYTIAGAGISLGLLAGMARGISDMTWRREPTVRPTKARKSKSTKSPYKPPYRPYKYKPMYTW